MSDFIIVHDKLLEYGGAEVVLSSIVKYRRPQAIICSCINNKKYWEEKYRTKIYTPFLIRFIHTQTQYKLFYPLIAIVCYFSRIALPYKNAFFIVYSSSAGKYFLLPNYNNAILYVNYHAKGLRKGRAHFLLINKFSFLKNLMYMLQNSFIYFEDRMAIRFQRIYAISKDSEESLSHLKIKSQNLSIDVLNCPSFIFNDSLSNHNKKQIPFSRYCVVVSRLYPEKTLECLLEFIYFNFDINIIIIGDGPLMSFFKKKYSDKFLFIGFLDSTLKNEIISKSLALFQPTCQEWSLVTVEANLLGVPVISASANGVREINLLISGKDDFPNLIYQSFDEIVFLLKKIDESRLFIVNNAEHIKLCFSEELFFQRLNIIENSIST